MRWALVAGAVTALGLTQLVASPSRAQTALPAFPGAQGFGAGTSGGRAGDVVIVDTLEPFGPGSLGEALDPEVCRPRIVVFAVSGVVEVPGPKHDYELTCGNLTIAGQTAPGAGITVHGRVDGYGADPAGNIIIRHVRFRPPPITTEEGGVDNLGQLYDSLQLSNNPNLMIDHVSLSWASDEAFDIFEGSGDATIQWTTFEVTNPEGQPEGPHNFAAMVGPDSPRVTIHHSLFAHHDARCPAMSAGPAELLNSVVYDCQDGFVHHNPAEGEFHIAGNTFIHGPSHEPFTPMYFDDEDPADDTAYWLSQNDIQAPGLLEEVVDDIRDTPLAEAAFEIVSPDLVIDEPADFAAESETYVPVGVEPPDQAFESVLQFAGAFPRDAVTQRTVTEVRDGTGSWDPNPPDDLLEGLAVGDPPADADVDGIADEWEAANGLDPSDGDDHATVLDSGYTAIEQYVNELADELTGAPAPVPASTAPGTAEPEGTETTEGDGESADPPIAEGTETTAGGSESADPPIAVGTETQGGSESAEPQTAGVSADGGSDTLSTIAVVLSVVAIGLAGAALGVSLRRRPSG